MVNVLPIEAFERAVAVAGGQTPFAAICGCTQGNVSLLLKRRSLLPARFVIPVEQATGVSRFLSRPDIYPLDGRSVPELPDFPAKPPRRRLSSPMQAAA